MGFAGDLLGLRGFVLVELFPALLQPPAGLSRFGYGDKRWRQFLLERIARLGQLGQNFASLRSHHAYEADEREKYKGGTDQYYLRNFVGFPLDTTIMISHLMFSGALDDLKTLRFVFSHGGGYLPYQIGRYVHGHKARPEARVNDVTPPAELFKRFYFDALLYNGKSVRHLIEQAGS